MTIYVGSWVVDLSFVIVYVGSRFVNLILLIVYAANNCLDIREIYNMLKR